MPTSDPSDRPPFLRAWTGRSSSRLEVSAALRMSASPMVRTFSAWAANSGLVGWAVASALRYSSTLASRTGMASSATAGAIFGAAVSWTAAGAAGATSVSDLVRWLEGLHRGRGGGAVNGLGVVGGHAESPVCVPGRLARSSRSILGVRSTPGARSGWR